MIYAAWLVIVIWGLLSLPLFMWLTAMTVPAVHAVDRLRMARVGTVAVVGLSDTLCAVAIGWLLQGHWLVSLLIGLAFFWLRLILAGWVATPEEPECEISLAGTDGELREALIQAMERNRQAQLLRSRMEAARRSGESLLPVIRENAPQSQRWTTGDTLWVTGIVAACGAVNLAALAGLVWLIGQLARG